MPIKQKVENKLKVGQVVEIEWTDHISSGPGWEDFEEAAGLQLAKCFASGYVIKENPDSVAICQSFIVEKDKSVKSVSQIITIGKQMISQIRILKDEEDNWSFK